LESIVFIVGFSRHHSNKKHLAFEYQSIELGSRIRIATEDQLTVWRNQILLKVFLKATGREGAWKRSMVWA
jgi:hypothetical protein